MTYLLDTDTCIHLLRGRATTAANARRCPPADLAVSAITRYELLYGVERCPPAWKAREGAKVTLLLEYVCILPFTGDTAAYAATLRATLQAEGRSIGPMDILIAATALENSVRVVTDNLAEFQRVPGLKCVSWSI